MPEIKQCTDKAKVSEVESAFMKGVDALIAKDAREGYAAMANGFSNGVAFLWDKLKLTHEWWYAEEEGKGVVGLLRLKIEKDAVHIDNVVALPGNGTLLIRKSMDRALALNKACVNLNAADGALPTYYKRFGFEFQNKDSVYGMMEVRVSALDAIKKE